MRWLRLLNTVLFVVTLPLWPFFYVLCRLQAKPCPFCGERWYTELRGEWDGEDHHCRRCGCNWTIPYKFVLFWTTVLVLVPTAPAAPIPKPGDRQPRTPTPSFLSERLVGEWQMVWNGNDGELVLSGDGSGHEKYLGQYYLITWWVNDRNRLVLCESMIRKDGTRDGLLCQYELTIDLALYPSIVLTNRPRVGPDTAVRLTAKVTLNAPP